MVCSYCSPSNAIFRLCSSLSFLMIVFCSSLDVVCKTWAFNAYRERNNKTETAVQSQDDEKNWHGRQSLNLIKKTENPLQDSARFCKILQESASIHRSLSSCHTAKTARFCKKLQDSARFCKILQDYARLCKTQQNSARSCKSLQSLTGH